MPEPDKLEKLRNVMQMAYITNDLDRAEQVMREKFGLERWLRIEPGPFVMADGRMMHVKVLIAYVGEMQFELVEPVAGEVQPFWDVLPADGSFAIRFQHICRSTASRQELDRLWDQARRDGETIPFSAEFGEGCAYFYIDASATLGHHLEFVYGTPDYYAAIPKN